MMVAQLWDYTKTTVYFKRMDFMICELYFSFVFFFKRHLRSSTNCTAPCKDIEKLELSQTVVEVQNDAAVMEKSLAEPQKVCSGSRSPGYCMESKVLISLIPEAHLSLHTSVSPEWVDTVASPGPQEPNWGFCVALFFRNRMQHMIPRSAEPSRKGA